MHPQRCAHQYDFQNTAVSVFFIFEKKSNTGVTRYAHPYLTEYVPSSFLCPFFYVGCSEQPRLEIARVLTSTVARNHEYHHPTSTRTLPHNALSVEGEPLPTEYDGLPTEDDDPLESAYTYSSSQTPFYSSLGHESTSLGSNASSALLGETSDSSVALGDSSLADETITTEKHTLPTNPSPEANNPILLPSSQLSETNNPSLLPTNQLSETNNLAVSSNFSVEADYDASSTEQSHAAEAIRDTNLIVASNDPTDDVLPPTQTPATTTNETDTSVATNITKDTMNPELLHSLFVEIAGIADQLQSGPHAKDMRYMLKLIFEMYSFNDEQEEEQEAVPNLIHQSGHASPSISNQASPALDRNDGLWASIYESESETSSSSNHNMNNSNNFKSDSSGIDNAPRPMLLKRPAWKADDNAPACGRCGVAFTVIKYVTS